MNREELKELGLNDEQIEAVMKAYGKSVNEIKEKADKVDEFESQIKDYDQQLKDRDKQLKDLSKKAEGNEELQQTIKDLQKANDDAKKEHEANVAKVRKESKLELALKDAKAHDPADLIPKLDLESIQLKDGELIGFNEQLDKLKEEKSYLFASEEPPGLKGRNPHVSDPNKQTNQNGDLQKQYEEAVNSGNMPLAVSIKNQLFEQQQNQNGE